MVESGQFVSFHLNVPGLVYERVTSALTSLNSPQNKKKNPQLLATESDSLSRGLQLPGWAARLNESEVENV